MCDLREKVTNKVLAIRPYLSDDNANELVDRLLSVDESLQVHLIEWVENRAFSDVWVREKYCIGAVLKMRGDSDFISALLAIDDYAKDTEKEIFLWQARV